MDIKNIIKIIIYILIITLFLQRIYNRQTFNKAKEIRQSVLISVLPYNCKFETSDYIFQLPDCLSYKNGEIVKMVAHLSPIFSRVDSSSDTGFFEKKGLIIESIARNQSILTSPELWFQYIFYIFQIKTRSALIGFLALFDANDGYLIGQLSFGFSQFKSESVSHLFKITGTQHLASISGYNLSLVVIIFMNYFKSFFGKKAVGILSLCVSSFYLLLIGNQIPLVRAFLMFAFSVISTSFLLRQGNSAVALFLAAIILILIDMTVLSSISFQLTFAATASIIYFILKFKYFNHSDTNKLAHLHLGNISDTSSTIKNSHISEYKQIIFDYIKDSIRISLYVQIMLTPLVLFHFEEVSVISLIVSIGLIWLVPGLTSLSYILFTLYLLKLNEILLRIFILPLVFMSKIFILILNLFDNQKYMVKISYFPWWYVLVWWLMVIIFVQLITKRRRELSLVDCV